MWVWHLNLFSMTRVKKTRSFLIFSQSDYLIQIKLLQIHILNGKQSRSRSVGFFRSQLIWICTFCKGRVYPGSAGQGLNEKVKATSHIGRSIRNTNNDFNNFIYYSWITEQENKIQNVNKTEPRQAKLWLQAWAKFADSHHLAHVQPSSGHLLSIDTFYSIQCFR